MISLLQVQKFRGKTGDNMADKNYLHTAYANSADGTDGFTTVYPRFNLLDGTKDFNPSGAGTNTQNQNAGEIYFTQNKKVADLFKAGDYVTISYDIEFLNTELYSSSEDVDITIQMYGGAWTWLSKIGAKNVDGKFYTRDIFKESDYAENPAHKVKVSRTIQLTQDFINVNTTVNSVQLVFNFIPVGANVIASNLKIELGSVATPHMPSASEAKTSDWPKYVGTYVDTNPVSSTVSSKYDWDEMKYRVYLDGVPVGGSKLLSFDLENLTSGTTYNVQVSQINGNVESDKSESVAFKTTLPK